MLRAFWYSKPHLNKGSVINFGDELSRSLIEKISKKSVKWVDPQNQTFFDRNFTSHILAIGSILHFGAKNSKVWGSGLIKTTSKAPDASYYAVRGKFTQKELTNRGYKVPEVYGDPGLLTPRYYNLDHNPKNYKIGIIPHYIEFDEINTTFLQNNFSKEFVMIDLRKSIEEVLDTIAQCEYIVSSSLHGIIVPQSFSIPTLRISFTDKILGDGIKYRDYFDSVGIEQYEVPSVTINNFDEGNLLDLIERHSKYLVIKNDLVNIQDKLLQVKPF